jgi:hypothetical protein
MSSALERRYRLLLSAYPDAYRDSHEEEIIATLMDGAASGQVEPTAREAIGLVVGGLRTRARLAVEEGRMVIWADGLCLAAVLLLASLLSKTVRALGDLSAYPASLMPLLLAVAIVAVVAGTTRLGLTVVVVAEFMAVAWFPGSLFSVLPWSWSVVANYDVLARLVVVGTLLLDSLRAGRRRPWPVWLSAAVISIAGLYGLSTPGWARSVDLIVGLRVPLSTCELVLPVAVLCTIGLVGSDPRLGIAATTYALVHMAAGVLGAVHLLTYGVNVMSLGPPSVRILLLGLGLTAAAAFVGKLSGQRLTNEHP